MPAAHNLLHLTVRCTALPNYNNNNSNNAVQLMMSKVPAAQVSPKQSVLRISIAQCVEANMV